MSKWVNLFWLVFGPSLWECNQMEFPVMGHMSRHWLSTTLSSAYQYFLAKTLETDKTAKKYMTWKIICWLGGDRIGRHLTSRESTCKGEAIVLLLIHSNMLQCWEVNTYTYIIIHTVKWIHNTRNTNFLCSIGNISIVIPSVSGMCCSPSRPKQCGFVQKRSYLPPIIAVSLFENWREPIDGWTTPRKKWSNMANYGSSFMVERQYLPNNQQELELLDSYDYVI